AKETRIRAMSWTTCRAVRIWPWALMMTPEPSVVDVSREPLVPSDWMTTSPGRIAANTPTPGGGCDLTSVTAFPTLWSAIFPTSALLSAGFDEPRTAIQLRPLTPSTTTMPRLTQALRRQRVERGGGPTSPSGETPANTSVGVPPYLIVIPT